MRQSLGGKGDPAVGNRGNTRKRGEVSHSGKEEVGEMRDSEQKFIKEAEIIILRRFLRETWRYLTVPMQPDLQQKRGT